MQALAPTGSIAISEQTRRLVEGYFALKPLGPTKVKGVSEPVNVYEVTGLGPLRSRLERAAGRGFTKFWPSLEGMGLPPFLGSPFLHREGGQGVRFLALAHKVQSPVLSLINAAHRGTTRVL